MKTVACVALIEFTRFVEGFGQVVGAPDSSLKEAQKPEVPEHVVAEFIADGLVEAPKGAAKAKAAAEASADDQAPA